MIIKHSKIFLAVSMIFFAQLGFAQTEADALRSFRLGREAEGRGLNETARVNYNEAVRICQNEISKNIATIETYVVLTWTLERQQKYNDVINWGKRGLEIKPLEYRIIETMGEAYFYLNNFSEALRCMQEYVGVMPQGISAPTAYFFIGEIFRAQRKFRYADIAYTTAVRLEANVALWWYRLGLARENAGDRTPAIEAYERSLRLDPNYQRTQEALTRMRAANRTVG